MSLTSKIAKVALGSSLLAGAYDANAQAIRVYTELPQDLVADGSTVYQMNVGVDLTQVPDIQLRSSFWKVMIPSFLTFADAQVPSSNDLFEGYEMYTNVIDTTPSNGTYGIVDPNDRSTFHLDGPSNTDKHLENLFFTVNTNVPVGIVTGAQYGTFAEDLYSTANVHYTVSNENLIRDPQSFNIHSALGDSDDDGDVDLNDLGALATNYGATSGASWGQGNFDNDGDVDLADLGTLATNYGAGSAQAFADFQSLVPEPSSTGLVALLGAGALAKRKKRK